MSLKMNILSILSLIQTLFFFSRGASYLYVDDIQNAFNNPLDAQIGNGTSKVLRSTTNTINHGLKIPYNFMVGVSDFDMPNTGFMDFALYNSTYINSSTTLKVDVFPNNGFYTLSYQVWVAMNDSICFIPVDFTSHPDFFAQFASGSGTRNLTYTIPYIAPNLTKFSNNIITIISYNRINASFPDFFCLRSYIHLTNSTHVIFSLQVDMKTNIYNLTGTLMLLGSDYNSRFGMSYKRFTLNPTKQMLTNPSSTDAAENLKYYPPDFMTARPTIISLFLNSWNISRTPRLTVRAYSSFEPNNVSVWYIFYKTMGNPIYQLEVDFIGVCTSDISCLVPISYYPQAQFSYSQKSDFWGMNISIPGTTNKTFSHSIVFSAFFSTTPKYAGIGFGYIYMKPNFKNLSVTIDNVQAQSIGYTVNCPLGDIYYLNLIGIASNWDGFQIYFYDFTTHPNFVQIFQNSVGYRVLSYAIPFKPSIDLASRKNATISFTEICYNKTSDNLTLSQNFISSNDTHVFIDIITEDDISWLSLKGYVFIYTLGPSSSNLELNQYVINNNPFLYNTTGYKLITQNITFSRLYAANPSVTSFYTHYKFSTLTPLIYFYKSTTNYYNPSTFVFINENYLSFNYGRFYQLGLGIVAWSQNPSVIPYFMPQILTPNANINQTIRLSIPYPTISYYILILTDRARYNTNMNLRFTTEASPQRIFSAYKFIQQDDNYMYVNVLPFDVPNPTGTRITFVIAPLYVGNLWAISSYNSGFQYFPTSTPSLDWIGSLDFNSFTPTQQNYSTYVASKFLEPDNTVPLSCQINITYTGVIRSLYINGEFMLTRATLNISKRETILTFRRTTIDPAKLIMITVIGRNLSIYDINLANCTDSTNNPAFVNSVSYFAIGSNLTASDAPYPNNTRCDPNCLSCKNLTYCFKCRNGNFQFQGSCFSKCPYPLLPTNGFCDISFQNQAIRIQPLFYDITNSSVLVNYNMDFVSNGNSILSLLLPEKLDYYQLPLIKVSNQDYFLGESEQALTRITTVASVGSYITKLLPLVSVNVNNQGSLYGFSTIANRFLLANYSSPDFNDSSWISTTYYQNLTNRTFSFADAIRIQFFLNCFTSCQFSLFLDGNIEIISNYRTTILYLDNITSYQQYDLKRKFTGSTFLTFQITNTTQFNLVISGSYSVLSTSLLFYEDQIIYPSINNCSISGCQNCASDVNCLSCQEGKFLTLAGRSCSSQCFTNYPFNIPERRCFCSDNIECMLLESSKCDTLQGICVPCTQDSDCVQLQTSIVGMMCDSGICKNCPDNCLKCNKTTCLECNTGFRVANRVCECNLGTVAISPSECIDICGDGFKPLSSPPGICDDNNTISGDGCNSTCFIEDGYSCQGGGPFSTDWCYKKPSMSILQATSNLFIVTFTQSMTFPANLSEIFQVGLSNVAASSYVYILRQINNKSISIEIVALQKIPKATLTLMSRDGVIAKDIYGNSLSNSQFDLSMKSGLNVPNKKAEELTAALTAFGTAVSAAATTTSGILFLTSFNPAIIWGLLNLFQLFYCLQLINVEYPQNVQTFFNIFSIGRLNMIPNPFESIAEKLGEKPLPVPHQFDMQMMNGLFLVNSGPMLVLWILYISFYISCFLLGKYYVRLTKTIRTLAFKVKYSFENGGMISLWIGSYFDIGISMFLQFRAAQFKTFFQVISLLSAIAFLSLNLLIPWREFVRPKKMHDKRKNPLYREFVEYPWFKHNYIYLLMFRRFLIAMILVFLHDYPAVEVGLLIATHVVPTLVTIFSSPYKKRNLRIIRASDDGIYFIVHFLVFILVYDNVANVLSEDSKLNLGWFIIALSLICVIVNLVLMIHGQILDLIKYIQLVRKGKNWRPGIQKRSVRRMGTEIYFPKKKRVKILRK